MHGALPYFALASLTLCLAGCVREEKTSAQPQPSPSPPSPTQPAEPAPDKSRPAKTRLIYTPSKKVPDGPLVKKIPAKPLPTKKLPAKPLATKKIPAKTLATKKLPAKPLPTKKLPAKPTKAEPAKPTKAEPAKAPAGGAFVLHEGVRCYRFASLDARGTLASRRKLLPGDVLLRVNGRPIGKDLGQAGLFKVLLSDSIKSLTVLRNGRLVGLK